MRFSLLAAAIVGLASAHGDHEHEHEHEHPRIQRPVVPEGADWTTRHMIEEHLMADFDSGAFFHLHDFDGTNEWTFDDIYKFYGMHHESTKHISGEEKQKGVAKVLDLYDHDRNGAISYAEYTISEAKGVRLPDLGFGPGHHGDDEYEYEIHHWQLYHDENTTEEDLIHPEDIEHFKHHEEMEAAQERQEKLDRMPTYINEANIPLKYRRS